MEDNQLYKLSRLITQLSTSGTSNLDQVKLKELKKICKQSDVYVKEAYTRILKKLFKKHAEIRLSAFQIIQELFKRSCVFRAAVIKDFKIICDLVLGINFNKPLPDPQPVSKKLKQMAVETIQKWYDEFGNLHPKLKFGYDYLLNSCRIDFVNLTARSEVERQRDEEERIRLDDMKQRKIMNVTYEVDAEIDDIKNTIVQFNNTFHLLVPDLKDFFILLPDEENDCFGDIDFQTDQEECNLQNDSDSHYGSDFMRTHGLVKGANVQIDLDNIKKVYVNDDNEVIVASLKEQINIISIKLLPKVKQWEQKILLYTNDCKDLLKKIINLKKDLEKVINCYSSITIIPLAKEQHTLNSTDLSSDDEDDLIEVTSNDQKVNQTMASEAELLGLSCKPDIVNDKDYSIPGTSGFIFQNSLKRNCKPKMVCPDSYLSSGNYKVPTKCINNMAGISQVWNANEALHDPDDDNLTKSSGLIGIDTTAIHFERDFEPVKWECRAPLKSGSLCPRKDREKCPFHGPIVARDEVGVPINLEDRRRDNLRRQKYERENPEWQDPQLLSEIRAATGIDLDMKKCKKRKKKYPNLTDLKAAKRTPRARLERKVLNKKALSRVNKALSKSA